MADIGASILDLAVRGYLPTMFAIDLQDMPHGPQRNELVAPSSGGRGYVAGTGPQWGLGPARRGGGLREEPTLPLGAPTPGYPCPSPVALVPKPSRARPRRPPLARSQLQQRPTSGP